MPVHSKHLIAGGQCYQTVREWRWLDDIACPLCQSTQVITRGLYEDGAGTATL